MKGNVIVGNLGDQLQRSTRVLPVYTGQQKTVERIKCTECFMEFRDY